MCECCYVQRDGGRGGAGAVEDDGDEKQVYGAGGHHATHPLTCETRQNTLLTSFHASLLFVD